jgi:dTMP kinase
MSRLSFFGERLPEIDLVELKGKLIVLEGTDGVGHSTQIGLLKQWLENHDHVEFHRGRVQGFAPTGRWHHRR